MTETEETPKTAPTPRMSGARLGGLLAGLAFVVLAGLMISVDYWRPHATATLSQVFGAPPELEQRVSPDDLLVLQTEIQTLRETQGEAQRNAQANQETLQAELDESLAYIEELYSVAEDYETHLSALGSGLAEIRAVLAQYENLPDESHGEQDAERAMQIRLMQDTLASTEFVLDAAITRIDELEAKLANTAPEQWQEYLYLMQISWSTDDLEAAIENGGDFTKALRLFRTTLRESDRGALAEPLAILEDHAIPVVSTPQQSTESATEETLLQQVWGEVRGLIKVSRPERQDNETVRAALQQITQWLQQRRKQV